MTSRLPVFCRWVFTFLTGASLLGVVAILAVIVINPSIESGPKYSTNVELNAPPGALMLKTDGGAISVTAMRASITGKDQAGLVSLFKRYGLPLGVIYTVFAAVLFDLFRRLFRNVERGRSFTPETIGLVRVIGFSLIGFSLVSSFAESFLSMALLNYFRSHSALAGPGLTWNGNPPFTASFDFPFGGSIFFAGLLVLALAEVFRQGLALKADADLTI